MPMIHDPDKDVREADARAMGAMRSTAATESLVLALIDEDHSVRLAAASALEQIDPHWILSEAARRAMARLELSANDNCGWVRAATVMLLEKTRRHQPRLACSSLNASLLPNLPIETVAPAARLRQCNVA